MVQKEEIGVIGLGYVGLPLAVALSKHFPVIGYDISAKRVKELKQCHDWSGELSKEALSSSKIRYTANSADLKGATFIIVTVPTPVTDAKMPDLEPVKSAAETVGKNIAKSAVVVLESTVYPGVTEEIVGPIIEKFSGLKCGKDFTLGYSPERINPGDKEHGLERVVKVVSGQDDKTLERVSRVYGAVCKTGVFKAASIKTAEAAKVIENIQRDLNIALMNELSIIFHRLGIRTKDVLDAASTKWNFMRFSPGLVGGHCIGVDPYYLTFRAQELGYTPEIILAGRRLNDNMAKVVVEMLVQSLNLAGKSTAKSTVLILGLTFKENVKDCRNSKVVDIIAELKRYGVNVIAFDPMLVGEPELVKHEFHLSMTPLEKIRKVDAVILAAPHAAFKSLSLKQLKAWMPDKPILIDVKGFFDRRKAEKAGFSVESL